MTAYRHYTPSNHYISLTSSTPNPRVSDVTLHYTVFISTPLPVLLILVCCLLSDGRVHGIYSPVVHFTGGRPLSGLCNYNNVYIIMTRLYLQWYNNEYIIVTRLYLQWYNNEYIIVTRLYLQWYNNEYIIVTRLYLQWYNNEYIIVTRLYLQWYNNVYIIMTRLYLQYYNILYPTVWRLALYLYLYLSLL